MTTVGSKLDTLPSEIQDIILSYLEKDDCWQCCTVSRSWQSMILNWQGMWTSLSTTDWDNILPRSQYYVPFISEPSVNHVCLVQSCEHELSAKIDFLVNLKCNAINDVELVAPHLRKSSMLKLATMFGTTLSRVSVSLHCSMEEQSMNEGPDVLLRHCPNLSKLVYIGSLPSGWTRNLEDIRHEHLLNLKMDIRDCNGDLDTEALFRATPKLQHLAMTLANVSEDSLLSVKLHRNCHELRSLFLTSGSGEDMEDLQTEENMKGLTIHDPTDKYPVTSDILRDFVNHTGVQYLNLSGTYLVGESILSHLSTIVFPSLVRLTIGDPIGTNLSTFLAHSVPNLEYLAILGDLDSYDQLLSSLCQYSSTLQEIHFGARNITEEALAQFLLAMTSLRVVNFVYDTPAVTSKILHLIAASAIQELQVNVDEPFGTLTVDSIEMFLEHVCATGKTLDKLKLSIHDCTDTTIFANGDKIKVFLGKLDSVAKEWELLIVPNIELMYQIENGIVLITHTEYRKQTSS